MKKLFWLALLVSSNSFSAEYIKYNSFDQRFQQTNEVLAEVHLPKNASVPYPVIITQHGSSQRVSFENGEGRTDVFSKSVIEQGTANGFAVIAIDAFYKKGLTSTRKPEFPGAISYAFDLKSIVSKDPRFDNTRIFYTGWSYGGITTLSAFTEMYQNDATPWRAVAPSEAGCQFQPKAIKLAYPVIFVMGEESHYPPKPCLYYADRLKEQGNIVETVVIPKANHHYSTYGRGRSGRSLSLNGCTDNPVIRDRNKLYHVDGRPTTREAAWKECTTWNAGDGGAEDKLELSVKYIIDFFGRYK